MIGSKLQKQLLLELPGRVAIEADSGKKLRAALGVEKYFSKSAERAREDSEVSMYQQQRSLGATQFSGSLPKQMEAMVCLHGATGALSLCWTLLCSQIFCNASYQFHA